MVYLFGQILFWIALSLAVGIALGWYIRGIIRGDAYQEMAMKEVKFERPARTIATGEGASSSTVLNDALMQARRELEACQQSLAMAEARLRAGGGNGPALRRPSNAASKQMPAGGRDDLKKIFGIGPYIERRLAEIEITTYRQIASLSETDIERIGEHLNYFPGRIERDGWQDSARRLHQEKYGEEI
jgi:predicted flap endonuclease-1-like 5' DNA nuclease